MISGGRVECGIGPRLPATRERDARPPLRLDDPGPGAQPQVVRGSRRDHEEMLDGAVVLASRREFLGSADIHEVEPQADHRLFPTGQGRAPAGGRDRDRRSRHVFGRQSGAGDDDDAEGTAGVSAAGAEAASADLGAADQCPLAQMGRRTRHQRRDDRRAERPAEEAISKSITRRRRRPAGPTCSTAAGSSMVGTPRSAAAS